MRGRKIGIAFVGTGSIADYHLAGLAGVPEAALLCVIGRDAAKAAAVAARYGVPDSSADYAATLSRGDIDAVVIATPDDTHEELAIRAAAAGKATLLQKPMAADVSACRRILDAADRAGVDLQVSFMHRYFEEFVRARDLVAEGAIGRIETLRMRNATPGPDWADWFFRKDRVSGGVVHQLGVHGIDLLQLVAGPITEIRATTAILRTTRTLADGRTVAVENPDSALATYRFAGGAAAVHEMSMIEAAGCDRFRMEIYGSGGAMWLRSELGPLAIRRRGETAWSVPLLDDAPLGLRHHRRWIDGLLGRAPSESTAQDALAGMIVAEAILASRS